MNSLPRSTLPQRRARPIFDKSAGRGSYGVRNQESVDCDSQGSGPGASPG